MTADHSVRVAVLQSLHEAGSIKVGLPTPTFAHYVPNSTAPKWAPGHTEAVPSFRTNSDSDKVDPRRCTIVPLLRPEHNDAEV